MSTKADKSRCSGKNGASVTDKSRKYFLNFYQLILVLPKPEVASVDFITFVELLSHGLVCHFACMYNGVFIFSLHMPFFNYITVLRQSLNVQMKMVGLEDRISVKESVKTSR